MKKILLTGFRPFQNSPTNASQIILDHLPLQENVKKLLLPVEYAKSFEVLRAGFEADAFDFVLSLGQAEGRTKIRLERIAVNLMDASLADEGGRRALNEPIHTSGPADFLTKLPLRQWVDLAKERALPLEISNSAGLFVCNDLYYRTQFYLQNKVPNLFVHLPLIATQAPDFPPGTPTQTLEVVANTILFLLEKIGDHLN